METIRDIDVKILDLEEQLIHLKAKRDGLQVQGLDLVGKYFKVYNFGSNYVHYIHVEETVPNNSGVTVKGELYTVLLTESCQSIEYIDSGKLKYEISSGITSNIFEEITKDALEATVKDALDIIGTCIIA